MPGPDPNIKDTSLFVQDDSKDKGAPDYSTPVWWLSPGVRVFPAGEQFTAKGQYNHVDTLFSNKKYRWMLNVHVRPEKAPYTGKVKGEVWFGVPSTVLTPANCQRIGDPVEVSLDGQGAGGSWITSPFEWTPNVEGATPGAAGTVHVCLIGRCYPADQTPDPQSFHCPEDQHVAQRNHSVVPVANKNLSVDIHVALPAGVAPGPVGLRVYEDRYPSPSLLQDLAPAFASTGRFRQVARVAPIRYGLDLSGYPGASVTDRTRQSWFGRLLNPRRAGEYLARVPLGDLRPRKVRLTADLSRSRSGDAHIFHVVQTGADGRRHGALTVTAIRE